MADVKIQDLLSATTVADTDLFVVEDNADTKKITKANLVETLGINGKAPTVHTHSMSQITDYEQGTWTPVVIGSTTAGVGTYTVRLGRYTKIGNIVHFNIYIEWSAHTGTGLLRISLPPFTSLSNTGFPISIAPHALTFTGQLTAMVLGNTQLLQFYTYSSGGPLAGLNMDTVATLFISGSYMTS